ncbi:MAG: nucleotide exchange factor GrpE [Desulfobacterium sp.]|jgi:molecular chaperone GrpE (heat shock protein)|nr:nucleotide exchange factor GrpE [Desulfobacterium sp.]
MATEKEQLKEKLVEFQQTIAGLKLTLADQESMFLNRQKELLLGLLDLMDAFESIEKNLEAKKDSLDKTAKMVGRNVLSIHKKLDRHLGSAGIVKMEIPGNRATMELCKVLDTRKDPEFASETICEVVKNGYINKEDGTVLRKAEVITVSK